MENSSDKPTLAVLGVTGGCVLAFTIKALEGGHNCIALVRNPSKLEDLLRSRNVSNDLIRKHLTVISGNIRDIPNITKTLFNESIKTGVIDIIVSGIGVRPALKLNPPSMFEDPTICEDATTTIFKSLRGGLKDGMKKPLFIGISTTGISDHIRDIPIAFIPLYRWLLPVPHADKKKMERLLVDEAKSSNPVLSGFVVVRASFLTDGALLGEQKVRVGIEDTEKVKQKAIGYTISRNDVGNWIYKALIQEKDPQKTDIYINQFVTITY